MHYEGNIIRPPSEADSILLQVTVGCSRNKCTFCRTYRGERFRIKKDDTIFSDIDYAAKHLTYARRLFLCDGDALIIPQRRLVKMLEQIRKKLPFVERVGVYANAKSIGMKTGEELSELKRLGLGIAYMGLESGDDKTLKAIQKGATSEEMIRMGKKVRKAGILLSVTVINGIAGKERSTIHARETGRVLTAMDPDYVGALSLMIVPNTPLYEDHVAGKFPLLDAAAMLAELREMFAATTLSNGRFHANHASNYLPIRAKLPEDKEKVLSLIDAALSGKIHLKPEYMRGL